MTDDDRQRLNLRVIRVTLTSALRHALSAERELCVARARQLLDHVREEATAASVIAEIDALEAELYGAERAAQQRGS